MNRLDGYSDYTYLVLVDSSYYQATGGGGGGVRPVVWVTKKGTVICLSLDCCRVSLGNPQSPDDQYVAGHLTQSLAYRFPVQVLLQSLYHFRRVHYTS